MASGKDIGTKNANLVNAWIAERDLHGIMENMREEARLIEVH